MEKMSNALMNWTAKTNSKAKNSINNVFQNAPVTGNRPKTTIAIKTALLKKPISKIY